MQKKAGMLRKEKAGISIIIQLDMRDSLGKQKRTETEKYSEKEQSPVSLFFEESRR